MTVANEENRSGPYIGNGVTTIFNYGFRILDEDHIKVIRTQDDIETVLTIDADYIVSDVGEVGGGQVALTAAPTAAQKITFLRNVPFTQETDLENQGPYFAETIESALDLSVMRDQQIAELFSRTIRLPASGGGDYDPDQLINDVQSVRNDRVLADASRVAAAASAVAAAASALLAQSGPEGIIALAVDETAGTGGDDRPAFQAAIDAVSAEGGGIVILRRGKTYRIVVDLTTPSYGLIMKPGVTLLVNGATVNLECMHEGVYGIRLQSNSHIIGPGEAATTIATMTDGQSIFNSPISVGSCYGEVTSVDAVGPFINASNWSVRNLTLTSVREGNGSVFQGLGGVNHGLLEDLTFPDNDAISIAIGFDHGTVGNVTAFDIPGTRARFEAGEAYSVFPHDIVIRRCKIGSFLKPVVGADGGMGIRLSGCYKFTIEDIEVAATSYAGFFHTAGDFGFEFAMGFPGHITRLAYRGTTVKNYHVYNAMDGYGFYCECLADNIAVAAAGGYVPRLSPVYNTDIVFEGCRSWTSIITNDFDALPGFYLHSMIGGALRNCYTRLHQYGVRVLGNCDELLIEGGEFANSYRDGIYIGDDTPPKDISVVGAKCIGNGQDPGATAYAGIRLGAAIRPIVERCRLGFPAESSQNYGVSVDTICVDASLIRNRTLGAAAGGVAYLLGNATSYGCVAMFEDNRAVPSVALCGGLNIIPVGYSSTPIGICRNFITSRATFTVAPGAGTWLAGDTIKFIDPLSTGYSGSKCTSAGTPGTWKNYGALT